MRAPVVVAAATGLLTGVATLAHAQNPNPPITDRAFTLDLYQGGVVGSYRIVGMGGVAVGTAEGAASMGMNPASVAVRPATSHDWWDWDVTFDALTPQLGSDYDGNGLAQTQIGTTVSSDVGGLLQLGRWGFGIYAASEERDLALDAGQPGTLRVLYAHLEIARSFGRGDPLTVGLGVTGGTLQIDAGAQTLVDEGSSTLEAGALWRPPGGRVRVGATVRLPIDHDLSPPGCDPLDCGGYILPRAIAVPWTASVGVAWRRAPSPWNVRVADDWRDERALVLAADVVVTGGVDGGAGIESFVDHRLQPAARDALDVSVRAGAEYEWIPGWLRVRGGAYYEPSRFPGVDGRVHVTSGLDVRVWSFCFLGDHHRLRFSLAFDAAARYGNAITSLGFWH